MERKELGKINKVRFGFGGYQDAMIGITFDLGGQSWGVGDFWGQWYRDPDEHCKWTRETQVNSLGEMVLRIRTLLVDAGVESVEQLKGVPVEVSFENMTLKSWRVLKEVL